jgi:hypothetical protein
MPSLAIIPAYYDYRLRLSWARLKTRTGLTRHCPGLRDKDGLWPGGDVYGLVRPVMRGALDPGADDRDVHGVEQPGAVMMPLEWLGIVMADNPVRTGDEARQLWP